MSVYLLLSIPWPIAPQNQAHPVGNSWGEYQEYYGDPSYAYLHPGVDVMGVSVGKEARAVAPGWVKAWMTISGDWHWRVATADDNTSGWSDGWLYAHIDPYRWHVDIGDQVAEGDLIGYLVAWPVSGFDHCHFARIRHHGTTWNDAAWLFIHNPLVDLSPSADTSRPVFENTGMSQGCDLAFRLNNSDTYLSPDSLYGEVDVIAKIYDKKGLSWGYPTYERVGPYRISYEVKGAVPLTLSFLFKDTLDWDNLGVVYTIYEYDSYLQTQGNYDAREFYYIVTNTDGDSTTTASDSLRSWDTSLLPDGDYWFVVQAEDEAGNIARDSCLVSVKNGNPGVDEGPGSGGLEMGPFVFQGQSWIRLPGGWPSPRLYDVSGKRVDALVPGAGGLWRIAPARKGIYFLRVGERSFRLVKVAD